MKKFAHRLSGTLVLAALSLAAVFIHGYHLGADDSAIYIPAIEKIADPALFPAHSEFFLQHASLSLFPNLVGLTARLLPIPLDWTLLFWHCFSIFLLLLAARQLLRACFESRRAEWAGLALLTCILTVPVAGTALVVMDPYLTARSLSTPATLFAIAFFAAGNWKLGWLSLLATALIHPQMAVYGAGFVACWWTARHFEHALPRPVLIPKLASLSAIPLSFDFEPARGVYRQVLDSRGFFSVYNWAWYEWIGVFAPLLALWWFSRVKLDGARAAFAPLCRGLCILGAVSTAFAMILAGSTHFDSFLRLQPMRSFHLIYLVFFVLLGGLLGDHVLKNRVWRWCALFLPLAMGMWTIQAQAYPSSAHVEWPGARYQSGWPAAFVWVRANTPKSAFFALDPDYMSITADDQHGFRAISERGALADSLKDSGAVSVFPQLGALWSRETKAQEGWKNFQLADFRKLKALYGVDWIILQRGRNTGGLVCPYRNDAVSVCQLDLL